MIVIRQQIYLTEMLLFIFNDVLILTMMAPNFESDNLLHFYVFLGK